MVEVKEAAATTGAVIIVTRVATVVISLAWELLWLYGCVVDGGGGIPQGWLISVWLFYRVCICLSVRSSACRSVCSAAVCSDGRSFLLVRPFDTLSTTSPVPLRSPWPFFSLFFSLSHFISARHEEEGKEVSESGRASWM